MAPLSEQDPQLWDRALIREADGYLRRAARLGPAGPRTMGAAIHAAWCARRSLVDPAPWPQVLRLYDAMLTLRDDAVVRLNRAVALAEVEGAESALAEVEALDARGLDGFLPYQAVRADLLRRCGRGSESVLAYSAALALGPGPAERLWLERRRQSLSQTPH